MLKKVVLTLGIIGIISSFAILPISGAALVDGFEGNTIRLSVDTPNLGSTIAGPYDAVVGNSIEFSPEGSYGGYYAIAVDIDISNDIIYFDYSDAGSGWFAGGTFNGYVFTDLNDSITDIIDVQIDEAITTIGIDSSRIFFNENQIIVNVEDLYHNSSSRISLDVDFAPVPVPGAVWLLGSGLLGLVGLKRRNK